MDAVGQWNYQHGVGAFMTISRVERYDHYWPPPFLRWICLQLNKPDFAAKTRSTGGRHLWFTRKIA